MDLAALIKQVFSNFTGHLFVAVAKRYSVFRDVLMK